MPNVKICVFCHNNLFARKNDHFDSPATYIPDYPCQHDAHVMCWVYNYLFKNGLDCPDCGEDVTWFCDVLTKMIKSCNKGVLFCEDPDGKLVKVKLTPCNRCDFGH